VVRDQPEIPDDFVYRQVWIVAFKREYMFVGEAFNPDTRSVAGLQLQELMLVTVRVKEALIEVEIIKYQPSCCLHLIAERNIPRSRSNSASQLRPPDRSTFAF
jgi:hypothetical protein